MSRMKRWTMSVTSWVDGVLAQVENHEATVTSAIARVRRSTAEARVRLRRVEQDTRRLRETLGQEREAEAAWRRRAKEAEDDGRALECLRRHKACGRRIGALEERLLEQDRARKELADGIKRLQGRLDELKERRNLMRARQSRAEAAHGMVQATHPMGDLEDVFDRWESRVGEIEIDVEDDEPIDTFEAEIEEEEQRGALLEELARLRGEKR